MFTVFRTSDASVCAREAVEAPFKRVYTWRLKALDPSKSDTSTCTRKTQDDFGKSRMSFGGAKPPPSTSMTSCASAPGCSSAATRSSSSPQGSMRTEAKSFSASARVVEMRSARWV
jgi:hypothetical protein